jgi:hypothetical protein
MRYVTTLTIDDLSCAHMGHHEPPGFTIFGSIKILRCSRSAYFTNSTSSHTHARSPTFSIQRSMLLNQAMHGILPSEIRTCANLPVYHQWQLCTWTLHLVHLDCHSLHVASIASSIRHRDLPRCRFVRHVDCGFAWHATVSP